MKKELFFILFAIFFQLYLTSAVQYRCSDNSNIYADSEEIEKKEVKSISGIKIGLCNHLENRMLKSAESTLYIDADLVTLKNLSQISLYLKQANITIKYLNVSDSGVVKLVLSGTTKELEVPDCSEIGRYNAAITEVDGKGTNATVKVLVGHTKRILNTNLNNSVLLTINSKKYAFTLMGGSSDAAIVKVSSCRTGNLTEIQNITNSTQITNQTTNNSTQANQTRITNQTITNSTQITNQSNNMGECNVTGYRNKTTYCNSNGQFVNQTIAGKPCLEDYECTSKICKEKICFKDHPFKRLLNWIKGIFS